MSVSLSSRTIAVAWAVEGRGSADGDDWGGDDDDDGDDECGGEVEEVEVGGDDDDDDPFSVFFSCFCLDINGGRNGGFDDNRGDDDRGEASRGDEDRGEDARGDDDGQGEDERFIGPPPEAIDRGNDDDDDCFCGNEDGGRGDGDDRGKDDFWGRGEESLFTLKLWF
jgi:hypothetical protein